MFASRGNVLLAFLGVYLILGFLTIFVFSEKEQWTIEKLEAFRRAGCIAGCRENVSALYLLIYLASCVSFW